MRIKKEYLILVIVIAALAAYLGFRSTDRSQYELPVLEPVLTEAVSKIGIKGPDGTVEIEKDGGKWFVTPDRYPANEGKVKSILEVMSQLKLTALVSESKNYDLYDLNEEKKTGVRAWAGDREVLALDIGKTASSFRHTFVKIAGDHRVYHARENFRSTFEQTVDSIREKTVLSFEMKDIRSLSLTKEGKTHTYVRMDEKTTAGGTQPEDEKVTEAQPVWKRSTGETVDLAKMNRYLSNLTGLECDRYLYDLKKADLKNPVLTVSLEGSQKHTLQLFNPTDKEGEAYPARSSQNDYPFELTKYRAEDIMKGVEEKEEKGESATP